MTGSQRFQAQQPALRDGDDTQFFRGYIAAPESLPYRGPSSCDLAARLNL